MKPKFNIANVLFIGLQENIGSLQPIALYNLVEAIPGHPKYSTVSRQTLESEGHYIPSAQYRAELIRRAVK